MQSNIHKTSFLIEEGTKEQAFLRGVVQGLMDIEEGREINLDDVRKRLGISK